MAHRNRNPLRPRAVARPSALTRTQENSVAYQRRLITLAAGRPHDTVPGRSAREWFRFLRPRLTDTAGNRTGFRNRIDEKGDLV